MSNEESKKLCLSLMDSDTKEMTIEIHNQAGYWYRPLCWRYCGYMKTIIVQPATRQMRCKRSSSRFFEENPEIELAGQIKEWNPKLLEILMFIFKTRMWKDHFNYRCLK